MKRKIMVALAVSAAVICFCSRKNRAVNKEEITYEFQTNAASQGKHCTYSVGCNCSGFSPITNGKEWEKFLYF